MKFKDIPHGHMFFDYYRSGEWLRKEADDVARCADGLLVCVGPDETFAEVAP